MNATYKQITFASQAAPRFLALEEAAGRLGLPEATEAGESAKQQVDDFNAEARNLASGIERWAAPVPVELNSNVQALVTQAAERRAERPEWWRKCRVLAVMRSELAGLLVEDLGARIQKLEKHLDGERRDVENLLAKCGHSRCAGMTAAAHLDPGAASRQIDYAVNNAPRVRAVLARIDNAKESRSEWSKLQSGSSELLAAIEASLADELRRLAEGN